MKATVSEKGQVTIPKILRQRLGIKAGQVLEFSEEKGRLIAKKAGTVDPVGSVTGVIKTGLTTNQMMKLLRGNKRP
jgi:antitoxin PrlF